MLAVPDGNAAIEFYKEAFGAKLLWKLGEKEIVAGLSIGGAKFFLAQEAPDFGTRGPSSAGFTTVRVEPLSTTLSRYSKRHWLPARCSTVR